MPPSPIGIENDTRHTKENTDHRGNLPCLHGYRKRYPAHNRESTTQEEATTPSWVSKTIPGTQEERTHTNTGIVFYTRQ